jgi:hypothetical protein
MAPDFFYRNVKALALLFDRIILWSPIAEEFDKVRFTEQDLVSAFTKPVRGSPVLLPAGRTRFFNPDKGFEQNDRAFLDLLGREADRQKTVLPLTARDQFYDLMRYIQKNHSRRYQPVFEEISRNFNTGLVNPKNAERVRQHGVKNGVSYAYAGVAEFLMDMRVCADLDGATPTNPPVRHIVDRRHACGYGLLSELTHPKPLLRKIRNVSSYDPLNLRTREGREEREVVEHVNRIFQAQDMPWREILKLRRKLGADIKKAYKIVPAQEEAASEIPSIIDIRIALSVGILAGSASLSVQLDHGMGNRRARSSSTPARPYIARLRVFSLLICPSAWPLLHGSVIAFLTASMSR